jgi:peptidoglycan hydrolase-like protein with peptidoglycan-binding domain
VRRRRVVAGGTALAVTGVAVAAFATSALSDGGNGSSTSPDGGTAVGTTATAQVTRQNLRETTTVSGTLGHGDTTPVVAGGAGMITAVPRTGVVKGRGEALYRVDDDPVVLLYGKLPAYRALQPGVHGRDVRQFEKNLAALGYDGFTVDDKYTSATASAVKQWQDDLGRAKTGTVDPSAIVMQPGKVRVDTVSLTKGTAVQPGTTVLKTSGVSRVVQATVELVDRPYAKVGAKVVVELPDGTQVDGRVKSAETVTSEDDSDPASTQTATNLAIDVVLTKPRAASGFDAAGVDVDLVVATSDDALAVPVSALLALSEGGYAVEKVAPATSGDGARTLVAVETGIYADGLVEITSGDLAEGDTVVVPA